MGQSRFLHLGLIVAVAMLAACGHDAHEKEITLKSIYGDGAAKAKYGPAGSGTGAITGKALWGEATPMRFAPFPIKGDAFCEQKRPSGIENEAFVLNDDGKTMRNVFVQIKLGIKKRYPAPSKPALLDQVNCQYTPHVLGVMVGQTLEFRNSDPILHNVHAVPRVKKPEINLPQSGARTDSVTFSKPEPVMVRVFCDVHGWMSSYVGVMTHPFFQVTGKDGSFELKNVPSGVYLLEAWSEAMEEPLTAEVTVEAGKATEVNFTFKQN
ncbi:MAG: carboxypeptidase regulatory-like domain-containing protein [Planctomycetota bacterium]